MARELGRADRLVRLLGVLGLGLVVARPLRQVALAEFLGDRGADRRERLRRHVDAVGPHVGDVAVLVEALGDLHGAGRGEAELPRGLLLQRRGGEGRRRVAADRLRLDRGDPVGAGPERRLDGAGGRLVRECRAGRASCRRSRWRGRRSARRRAVSSVTSTLQYSCGLKISISRSRSQTRRSATDCTRPAERAPGSFRHSTGESVKPTR